MIATVNAANRQIPTAIKSAVSSHSNGEVRGPASHHKNITVQEEFTAIGHRQRVRCTLNPPVSSSICNDAAIDQNRVITPTPLVVQPGVFEIQCAITQDGN